MSTAQAAIYKRIGRSIFSVLVAAGIQYFTGSPYSLIVIPILQGIGKWLREEKQTKLIPF